MVFEFLPRVWLLVGCSREEERREGPGRVEGRSGSRCDQNTQRTIGSYRMVRMGQIVFPRESTSNVYLILKSQF